jgi:uncharacterized protein (DUF885 family)
MDQLQSLTSLSETVAELTKTLTARLAEGGFAQPSFAEYGLAAYPDVPNIVKTRKDLISALQDSLKLITGPTDSVFSTLFSVRLAPFRVPGTI